MVKIDIVLDARAELGEGPLWDEATNRLWWIDIRGANLHRFDPASGRNETWSLREPPGSLALTRDGRLAVALASGLAWFDEASGTTTPFLPIEADKPATRLNDGRVDHKGRFWVGSMARTEHAPIGTFYRATIDGKLAVIRPAITVPNCTAFSPDGGKLYFTDTPTRRILTADIDQTTGNIGPMRLFAEVPQGGPDGGTVDAEAHLWVALWGGSALARYRPDGSLERLLDLPVRKPTCPSFGGPGFGIMYVTSARVALDDPRPGEGGLLAIDCGIKGLPECRFGD